MNKNKNVREVEIVYLDKGKEITRAKRIEAGEDGVACITYKYENPKTGHYVKWLTFYKIMQEIDHELADRLKDGYPWSDVDLFKSEDVLYIEISVKPFVVLRRGDKFLYRKYMANGYMFYDVLKRDNRLVITTSVVTPDYEDDDAALAKIGIEMFNEHFPEVLSKHQGALLRSIEIEEYLERKGIPSKYIETRYESPTIENPKLRDMQMAIKCNVPEDVFEAVQEMTEGYNIKITKRSC